MRTSRSRSDDGPRHLGRDAGAEFGGIHGRGDYRARQGREPVDAPGAVPRARTGSGRAAGDRRPCQNSTVSGRTRKPPQFGGRGTSSPANRSSASATRRSSSSRLVQHRALARRPRAQLRLARPRGEVRVGLGRSTRSAVPVAFTWRSSSLPQEHEAGVRVLGELPALAAVVVREEHEAALVDAAQQHVADRGAALARRRSPAPSRSAAGCPRPRRRRASAGTARSGRRGGPRDRAAGRRGTRSGALHRPWVGHDGSIVRVGRGSMVPPAGLEPALPAPEAGALSAELRGRECSQSSNGPCALRPSPRLCGTPCGGPSYARGMAHRVLLVDDDPVIVRLLEVNFRLDGYTVETASRGERRSSAPPPLAPTPSSWT